MHPSQTTPSSTTPAGPLSPGMQPPPVPLHSPADASQRDRARPNLNMRLPAGSAHPAGLGRFHPKYFESASTSGAPSPTMSRPVSSRGLLSPPSGHTQHPARKRQQLEHYHELLAAAATSLIGPAPASGTPKAPHLHPLGSPGPATPLNLEESPDYFGPARIGEGSPRSAEMRAMREEQRRRSGMHVDQTSPAVSPRC